MWGVVKPSPSRRMSVKICLRASPCGGPAWWAAGTQGLDEALAQAICVAGPVRIARGRVWRSVKDGDEGQVLGGSASFELVGIVLSGSGTVL